MFHKIITLKDRCIFAAFEMALMFCLSCLKVQNYPHERKLTMIVKNSPATKNNRRKNFTSEDILDLKNKIV